MPFSAKVLIPFKGYRDYITWQLEFFSRYNSDVKVSRHVYLENTAVYFLLGAMVVMAGWIFGQLHFGGIIPFFEIVSIFLVLAATVEVDFMIWLHWKRLGWKYWKNVPVEIARREGRGLVMAGMYQAGLFYLAGFLISYALIR